VESFKLFDVVEATTDVPQLGLPAGVRGTIVDIHREGLAYEVEFEPDAQEGLMLAALRPDQLRLAPLTQLQPA